MVNMWSTGLDAAGVQLQHLWGFTDWMPSSLYLDHHARSDQHIFRCMDVSRTSNSTIFPSIQYTTREAFSRGYTPHIRDDITKHALFSLQNLPVFSPCVSSLCASAAALPVLMSLFRFIKGLSEFSCCPWNRRRDRCFPISGKVGCFRFHN